MTAIYLTLGKARRLGKAPGPWISSVGFYWRGTGDGDFARKRFRPQLAAN